MKGGFNPAQVVASLLSDRLDPPATLAEIAMVAQALPEWAERIVLTARAEASEAAAKTAALVTALARLQTAYDMARTVPFAPLLRLGGHFDTLRFQAELWPDRAEDIAIEGEWYFSQMAAMDPGELRHMDEEDRMWAKQR
jgi:hypothetical protein